MAVGTLGETLWVPNSKLEWVDSGVEIEYMNTIFDVCCLGRLCIVLPTKEINSGHGWVPSQLAMQPLFKSTLLTYDVEVLW